MDALEAKSAQLSGSGRAVLMASPQDVSRVLFNVLKLPQPPNAKSLQSGMCSTDKKVC